MIGRFAQLRSRRKRVAPGSKTMTGNGVDYVYYIVIGNYVQYRKVQG